MSEVNESRRSFVGAGAAAFAGLTVAPGIVLYDLAHGRPAEEPATPKVRWGMLIDSSTCQTGCDDCVSACNTEHGLTGTRPIDTQYIRKVDLRDKRTGVSHSLPMLCQHCEDPPCVDVCPTGASFRRADGIVLVDRHICIGCRYCMMACPYKARSFVHENLHDTQVAHTPRGKGCVESCNFCVHRVDVGGTPACVEACEKAGHGAMIFGDLNDPESAIAKRLKEVMSKEIRADLGLNLGVRYSGI